MPTRPAFDLVSIRKETKERLRALKGDSSFDDVIQGLLDRATTPPSAPLERPKDAEEQSALADLAARRWRLAVARGQIVERGPRLLEYRTGLKERRRVDVRAA